MRIILYYFVILIIIKSHVSDENGLGVIPVTATSTLPPPEDTYILFNKTNCLMSDDDEILKPYGQSHFQVKKLLKPGGCKKNEKSHLSVTVPAYYISNLVPDFMDEKTDFQNRTCILQFRREACPVTITFRAEPGSGEKKETSLPGSESTGTSPSNEIDPNLYIYIGAGVAVVVLIVAIQTVCIVSYSRKVARAHHALQTILRYQNRQPSGEENERYSHGPVAKKPSPPEREEDALYESLEHLAAPTANGNGGTIKSVDIRNRPPLPLPHDVSSEWKVNTLQPRTNTQKEFIEKQPDPTMFASLKKSMMKPKVMQDSPGNTLPHMNLSHHGSREGAEISTANMIPPRFVRNESPSPSTGKPPCYPVNTTQLRNAPHQESRERLLKAPGAAGVTSFRVGPNVLPKNVKASPVMDRLPRFPVNTSLQRNVSQKESRERIPDPSTPTATNTIPLRVPQVSKKNASDNVVNELSKVFSRIIPPVKPTMDDPQNSSDEEWTYEKLPPTKKYLQ